MSFEISFALFRATLKNRIAKSIQPPTARSGSKHDSTLTFLGKTLQIIWLKRKVSAFATPALQ